MSERPDREDWRPEGDQESNRDIGQGSDVIGGSSGRAGGSSDVVGSSSDLGPDTGTATREPDTRGGEVY